MALVPLLLTLIDSPGYSFDGFHHNSRGNRVVSCDMHSGGGLLMRLEVLGGTLLRMRSDSGGFGQLFGVRDSM